MTSISTAKVGDGELALRYVLTHSAVGSVESFLTRLEPYEEHLDRGRFRTFSLDMQEHTVEVSFSLFGPHVTEFHEYIDWIGENVYAPWSFKTDIGPQPITGRTHFTFRSITDAIAFKLRFS